jgi:hypothetical protein
MYTVTYRMEWSSNKNKEIYEWIQSVDYNGSGYIIQDAGCRRLVVEVRNDKIDEFLDIFDRRSPDIRIARGFI